MSVTQNECKHTTISNPGVLLFLAVDASSNGRHHNTHRCSGAHNQNKIKGAGCILQHYISHARTKRVVKWH